ncbi:MAG: hypothetical protein A2W22_03875 [Candidatus Levybacteria bacterium RBG_16_35_11]|nr:MAG: hypothetical protein A2W22_03875 [Candidatus Levybacteria bacterium RBG_16_35_11]
MIIGIDATCLEDNNRTGLYTYLMSLLENLPKISPKNEYRLYFKNSIPSISFGNSGISTKALRKPSLFFWTKKPLWYSYCLPKELLINKVDLFFSPSYVLPRWLPVRSIVCIHDISFEAYPDSFPRDWLSETRNRIRESARKASLVVTNSIFCKREIKKHYNIPEKKIFVIRPGISRHFTSTGVSNSAYQASLINKKYDIKKPFIISVGNLYPRRNTPALIKAFKKIGEKINNYQLVIIGKNQEHGQENVKKLIARTNKELSAKRILHYEFVPDEDLEYLFKNADLFVSLSNYEGFGCYSMLEAMIYGCPVLAVKTSSMPEVIGNAGIYTSHDNIEKISSKIYYAIKNRKLRKELSIKGADRIKIFSTKNMAKQFLKASEYVVSN